MMRHQITFQTKDGEEFSIKRTYGNFGTDIGDVIFEAYRSIARTEPDAKIVEIKTIEEN